MRDWRARFVTLPREEGATVNPMAAPRTRRARVARRRARRVAASGSDLTDAEWILIRDAWGRCAYCGRAGLALQKDCVLPISRGGRYTIDNVVPACGSCNASKCNAEVTSWMRRRRLDERAFLLAWALILRELRERHEPRGADATTARTGPASA